MLELFETHKIAQFSSVYGRMYSIMPFFSIYPLFGAELDCRAADA